MQEASIRPIPTQSIVGSITGAFLARLLIIGFFVVALVLDALGEAPYFGLLYRLYPQTLYGAILVSLFLLLLLLVTPGRELFQAAGGPWGRRILMLLCLLPAALTLPFMGGTPSRPVQLVFAALALVWLFLLIRNPPSLMPFFFLGLAYSFIQRFRFLNAVANDPEHADMLPVIQAGAQNFLAGNHPYIIYKLPWDVPLPYWPVTWLSYLPAVAAKLDVRLINILAEVGIVLLFLSAIYAARNAPEINLPLGFATFVLVLPTSMFWDSFTSHQIWWFWLIVSVRLLMSQRFAGWSAATGIGLAASQLGLTVLPTMGFYVWRKLGLPRAILYMGGALLVAAAIILPFWITNPSGFWNNTIAYYADPLSASVLAWNGDKRWLYILGFAGEAWTFGVQNYLRYLQAIILLVLAGVFALRYRNSVVNVVRFCVASVGFFLLFSHIIWMYYYEALLLLLMFYMAALALDAREAGRGNPA